MTSYEVPDSPKMLRETLCVAQSRIGHSGLDQDRRREHVDRLQRLIDACDLHRPLGPDGKHRDRHTPTCGCTDVPRCQEPTCPDFGDPDFGEATCPAEHAVAFDPWAARETP